MYFALFYLLFFTLDILFSTSMQTIGLTPVNYLVAGVGSFCLFFLWKRILIDPPAYSNPLICKLFYIDMFLITIFNFLMANLQFFQFYDHVVIGSTFNRQNIVALNLILFVLILCLKTKRSQLHVWIEYSVLVSLIWYSIPLIIKYNMLTMRWGGLVDILMLYGWLRIIDLFMAEEYKFGN